MPISDKDSDVIRTEPTRVARRSPNATAALGLSASAQRKSGRAGALQIRPASARQSSALGWARVGLGLAQLLASKRVAQLIGADADDTGTQRTLRLVGGRELACGIGLLSQSHSAGWAWASVAGDVLDLALVGTALQSKNARAERLLLTGASVLGIACLDAYVAYALQRQARDLAQEGVEVHQSVTIARQPGEVYAFVRDFENLPKILSHLESVRVDNGHSHWAAKGPLGTSIEWDAEIVEDRPGQLIAWRSIPPADVAHQGRVELRPLGNLDTELDIVLRYDPPVGKVGDAIAHLLGVAPSQQLAADLRRLKQILETGEVLHSDSSIHRGRHPAQPSALSTSLSQQVRS